MSESDKTTKKEKHICCGKNKSKQGGYSGVIFSHLYGDSLKCTCTATIFENNKWYCKRHAPSKIAEREAKSWKKYIEKIRRNTENPQI